MVRRLAVAIAVLCVWPDAIQGQTARVTVTVPSADVRSAPSVVNPVVGRAPRGTSLDLARDVGDWYKVSWPQAKDGVGYVRRSDVTVSQSGSLAGPAPSVGATVTGPSRDSITLEKRAVLADLDIDRQPSALGSTEVIPPSHALGLAVLADRTMRAGSLGFGVAGRAWASNGIGLHVELVRHVVTSAATEARMTSSSIASSVLFALPQHLTELVWFRPYVGAGAHLNRSSLSAPGLGEAASSTSPGFQAFGGGELTLAGAPSLALSTDMGYRWGRAAFAGFDRPGIAVTVAAHWYIR